MANLDQRFQIVGDVTAASGKGIEKALKALGGVNYVSFDSAAKTVTVGYTPGIINIQNLKDAIESQGLDVSDQGDD